MEQSAFINSVKSGAIAGMTKYGILASLTIAQAAYESGWGNSAPGNNLFGIKWTSGYASQTLSTKEFINGVWETVNAQFRAYSSWADSVMDHALFLTQNSNYKNIIGVKDYKTVCELIKQDGYATDPNYASTLIEIIEENSLTDYDTIANYNVEVKKVNDIVIYADPVDQVFADQLADFLKCPTINGNRPYDYSNIKNVYWVGGPSTLGMTHYVTVKLIGANRQETETLVNNFITSKSK
jgi:hypothetical protein